ncbi:MAG: hypothetical protein WAO28_04515 [Candidatus Microsaccharimonas sp.]
MAGSGYQAENATRSGSAYKRAKDNYEAAKRKPASPDNNRATEQARRDMEAAERKFNDDYRAYAQSETNQRNTPLSRDRFIS